MDAVYDTFDKRMDENILFQSQKTKYFLENISDYDETKSYVVNVFH